LGKNQKVDFGRKPIRPSQVSANTGVLYY